MAVGIILSSAWPKIALAGHKHLEDVKVCWIYGHKIQYGLCHASNYYMPCILLGRFGHFAIDMGAHRVDTEYQRTLAAGLSQ